MAPLTADAKRMRTIIISFPLLVVTSAILYRRTFMGEQQRQLPSRTSSTEDAKKESIIPVGGTPWQAQGGGSSESTSS